MVSREWAFRFRLFRQKGEISITLQEVISYADKVKPNAFDEDTKTLWINEVEGMVQLECMLLHPDEAVRYEYDHDQDTELLVRPPHDKLYRSYLVAMIDWTNSEYGNYENTMSMFNAHYDEYRKWFSQNYRPADTKDRRRRSAYR